MITAAIILFLLSIPSSLLSDFDAPAPDFMFDWTDTLNQYFAVIRYILPLRELIPLFICVFAIIAIRIAIAVVKLIFGKVVPVW